MNTIGSTPAVDKTAFDCPHCGVRAMQFWYAVRAQKLEKGKTPTLVDEAFVSSFKLGVDLEEPEKQKALTYLERASTGELFLHDRHDTYSNYVANAYIAQCDHCAKISLWLRDVLTYPVAGDIKPHKDLPDGVTRTFAEASKVADISPRASAALSRLAIQELCVELGCKADDLNRQIGELVESGLSPDVSRMLDSVRVIGNNAVHPGEIDMRDDSATAKFLLECINRICQRMITERKEIDALYEMLPDGAKASIEKRNAAKTPVLDVPEKQ